MDKSKVENSCITKSHSYLLLGKNVMSNALIYIVWASMLFPYLIGVVNKFPLFNEYPNVIIWAIIVIPAIFALPFIITKLCLADYFFYVLLVIYYLACYAFFPENASYLTENAFVCICCVFTYFFIGRIINIDKSFNIFILISAICIYADLFFFLVYAPEHSRMEDVAGDDNMWAAYQVLPHVLFMIWTTLEKFRLWKVITSILGVLFLLSCGTRGPFVCIAFFCIIYFFFYMKFKGAIYIKIGIVTTILILLINLKPIISFLVKTLTGLQLSTRILEKIVTGELGNDSYRSILRDKLYSVMEEGEHFWGLGVFGCRHYDIIYPHFLPLDFFCTFGYFIGSILLISLFLLIGWAFWVTKGQKVQVFILYLFSISIIKLMLSNSFVLEPYFYMLIGVCVTETLYCCNPNQRMR